MHRPSGKIFERKLSMTREKRSLDPIDGDDNQQSESKHQKVPALASVIVEALKVDSLQKLCSSLEPILRRLVSEEVERALAKLVQELTSPVISARGGLSLTARLLAIGDSLILLFASEDTIRTCLDLHQALLSLDAGVVLSSDCFAPFFKRKDTVAPILPKKPASLIIATSDRFYRRRVFIYGMGMHQFDSHVVEQ